MKKKYRINWWTVARNIVVLFAITSLTMATVQLVSLGLW